MVRVLGTYCVINCLNMALQVPITDAAVFTDTLRSLVICTTSMKPNEMAKVKQLVEYMGGHFSRQLFESTTHLITNSVLSNKYEVSLFSIIFVEIYLLFFNYFSTTKRWHYKEKFASYCQLGWIICGRPANRKLCPGQIFWRNHGVKRFQFFTNSASPQPA